jgi:asparagine synthase (glutamine-hydrolysing)
MCGIVAISSPEGRRYDLTPVLDAIRHRGPDGAGTFTSNAGDAHLGHVRLSIIDLSPAGHQPMADASGRYVVSFNGEIYNYRELKQALVSRHGPIAWRSNSDTEVIVEGYAREGQAFLERLNGIFALAIFDTQAGTLSLLRDPVGIKPLFFTEQRGSAYFCSELKGLLALPDLVRTLRRESVAEQLAFMYVPEPNTLYAEFRKLEPGMLVVYRQGRRVAESSLFGWMHAPLAIEDEAQAVEAFSTTFASAVRRQLVSDAPVSLMLSGGLDSSAVAFEAVRGGAAVKDAYTISFAKEDMAHDQQSDDLHYARLMADRLGLRLEVIPAQRDFLSMLPSLSRFLEDGISDPAAINTYLICQSARNRGVKVMLTGQGADEYLGGYRRYVAHRMLSAMPVAARAALALAGKLLPTQVPGRFNAAVRRLNRMTRLAGQPRSQRLLALYTWAESERLQRLFLDPKPPPVGADLERRFQGYAHLDDVEAMMRVDHHYDLLSLNLTYTDRLSMATSVEARVPFLDFELVRLMNSIPVRLKIKDGVPKHVLKKAMDQHLPREVVYRPKAGFALPIRAWMRQDNAMLRHYFEPRRIRDQGLFDPAEMQSLVDEQFGGRQDHSNELFSMLCVQVWLDSLSGRAVGGQHSEAGN